MPSTWIEGTGSDYLDTVSLLQEEIARLEDELRRRDEAVPEPPHEPQAGPAAEVAESRVGELTALLAERDETIRLLCDQLAALEEAGAARSAEWEQMDRWLRALEEKIDREAATPQDPDDGLRQSDALREQIEGRERAWEAESARLEQEIAGLRARLAEAPILDGDHARAALESENHRIRDECRRLAGFEAAADEAEALRERCQDLQDQCDQARSALIMAKDDLRRERFEFEVELVTLRASLASAKACRPSEPSVDERIMALSLHLREVHERDEKERAERQIFNRLSRLWRRPASR